MKRNSILNIVLFSLILTSQTNVGGILLFKAPCQRYVGNNKSVLASIANIAGLSALRFSTLVINLLQLTGTT